MFNNKFLVSSLLLCSTLLLSACGGAGGPFHEAHVDEASVEPSVIPAPTAGNPVQFKVRARVRAESTSDVTLVTPVNGDPLNRNYPLEKKQCTSCDSEVVEIVCTSSVSPTDPQSRLLSCPGTASMYYFGSNPVGLQQRIGTTEWAIVVIPASARGGKGANLLAEDAWRRFPVTVQ